MLAEQREQTKADEFQEDVNLRRTQELSKLQSKVVQVIQAMIKIRIQKVLPLVMR